MAHGVRGRERYLFDNPMFLPTHPGSVLQERKGGRKEGISRKKGFFLYSLFCPSFSFRQQYREIFVSASRREKLRRSGNPISFYKFKDIHSLKISDFFLLFYLLHRKKNKGKNSKLRGPFRPRCSSQHEKEEGMLRRMMRRNRTILKAGGGRSGGNKKNTVWILLFCFHLHSCDQPRSPPPKKCALKSLKGFFLGYRQVRVRNQDKKTHSLRGRGGVPIQFAINPFTGAFDRGKSFLILPPLSPLSRSIVAGEREKDFSPP